MVGVVREVEMLLFPGWKLSRINLGSAYLLSAASISIVRLACYVFADACVQIHGEEIE